MANKIKVDKIWVDVDKIWKKVEDDSGKNVYRLGLTLGDCRDGKVTVRDCNPRWNKEKPSRADFDISVVVPYNSFTVEYTAKFINGKYVAGEQHNRPWGQDSMVAIETVPLKSLYEFQKRVTDSLKSQYSLTAKDFRGFFQKEGLPESSRQTIDDVLKSA